MTFSWMSFLISFPKYWAKSKSQGRLNGRIHIHAFFSRTFDNVWVPRLIIVDAIWGDQLFLSVSVSASAFCTRDFLYVFSDRNLYVRSEDYARTMQAPCSWITSRNQNRCWWLFFYIFDLTQTDRQFPVAWFNTLHWSDFDNNPNSWSYGYEQLEKHSSLS